MMECLHKVADIGQRVVDFRENGVFIVLVGIVIIWMRKIP